MMLARWLIPLLLLWPAAASAAVEIGFHSRAMGRTFPHALMTLRGTVDSTGEVVDTNIGFTVRGQVTPAVLMGPVKGGVLSLSASYVAGTERHFALVLSDEEYRAVLDVVERWRALPQPSYELGSRNCVHFVAEVAAALGLAAAPEPRLMKKPRSFLEKVRRDNEALIASRAVSVSRALTISSASRSDVSPALPRQ